MKISSRCDYACRALAELAVHYRDRKPIQISLIARNQKIPEKYLVHILNLLRRQGLVASKRGKHGGYSLAKEPTRITLGQVIRQVDGPLISTACVDETTKEKCSQSDVCPFRPIWQEVDEVMGEVLDKITFEDIAEKMSAPDKRRMYYI
jgi:Rrf2 family protein